MIRAALLAATAAGPAAADGVAFVTAQNAGQLAIIDLASGAARAVVALPGKPAAVACRPGGGVAVVEAEDGRVSLVAADGRVGVTRAIPGAFGVAIGPDGAVFVTDWDGARLLRLDPATLGTVWSVPTGPAPTGLAVTADGVAVAVAERDGDSLGVFAAADGRLVTRTAVGAHPFGVTIRDGRAWTADVEANTVTAVDLATGKVAGTVPVGHRPYAVAFSGDAGFVTNQHGDSLTRFDPATLEPQGEIAVGETPEGIDTAPDGSLVVANWFSNTLTIVDPATGAVREIATPDGPRAFGRFVCP